MKTMTSRYYYVAILGVLGLIGTASISLAATTRSGRQTQLAGITSRLRQLHKVEPDEQNPRAEAIRQVLNTQTRAGGPSASQQSRVTARFAHARQHSGQTGVVKWFNAAKGFGFITPDDGSEDLYAHFAAITMNGFKSVKEGTRVTFDVLNGPKGKQASNIQLIGK